MGYFNVWAIVVSVVASMIIGSFWYSPAGFGTAWMKLVGLSKRDIEKAQKQGMAKSYITAILASVLTTLVLSVFVTLFPRTILGGALGGFIAWAGFIATTQINRVIWEQASPKLFLINNGFFIVNFLVMGAILGAWT